MEKSLRKTEILIVTKVGLGFFEGFHFTVYRSPSHPINATPSYPYIFELIILIQTEELCINGNYANPSTWMRFKISSPSFFSYYS